MVTIIKKGMHQKEVRSILVRINKKKKKGIDLKKYCGVIELKDDPLKLQQKMRDDWG